VKVALQHLLALTLAAASWCSLADGAAPVPGVASDQTTADHSKFPRLQQEFRTGPEVTRACLDCHTEAAKQIHKTKHWTWDWVNPATGQQLGKKNVINNFCTSIRSNESFCSACHIGYGWQDDSFDFSSEEGVDCLVCHDTTETYKKIPGLAGHPNYQVMEWPPKSGKLVEPPDLARIAQSVGKTSRKTCGACHFFGGGGNAVKHGDLDSSLEAPSRFLDVHMDSSGLNFSCARCHVTDRHEVSGSRYAPIAADQEGMRMPGKDYGDKATTCRACHGNAPHSDSQAKLNDHTRRIACQTCHIPAYATGPLASKMSWDWSTGGRLDEHGERIKLGGSEGRDRYDSNKGDFTYERYVIPDYQWFNGQVRYTLFGDPVAEGEIVQINEFLGGPDDPASRIWPVRSFRGKQPYDKGLGTLAVFQTAGPGDAAFWENYDWDKALEVGMRSMGVEYSGQFGFVETEMYWPITHMVAPKEDSLRCIQCHREGGRLEGVDGIYLPGRDRRPLIDTLGPTLAFLTLLGVLVHGGLRLWASRKKG
jgi:octaheme c-type cytochrome (tetrathionate reductase family)